MWKTRYMYTAHGWRQIHTVTVGEDNGSWPAPSCRTLCEKPLRRPHLTCLWCRPRRVYYGKMEPNQPVQLIVLPVHRAQHWPRLKHAVRKFLFTLIGWTLN